MPRRPSRRPSRCSVCDGRQRVVCPGCGGLGERRGNRCGQCRGNRYVTCPRCNGSGQEPYGPEDR
jgi:DnaJ-class molecular chaperone